MEVNGEAVCGLDYPGLLALLRAASRPLQITFGSEVAQEPEWSSLGPAVYDTGRFSKQALLSLS